MGNPAEAAGPVVVGIFLNAILLGVMSTQVYLYFTSFKNDRLWIKIYVAFLFACDIANTACNFAGLYDSLILHFGDFNYLGGIPRVLQSDPAFTGTIASIVQLFYAWRIHALIGSKSLAFMIVVLAIIGGVNAILTSVKISMNPVFALLDKEKVESILYLSSEVIGDIIITSSLVTFLDLLLPQSRRKTGIQQTDLLIDRIIRLTIQTGMLTSIVAAINLIVYLVVPSNLHLLFNFILCKLYSNSLMSTLNSRGVWMKSARLDEVGSDNVPPKSFSSSFTHTFRAALPSRIKSVAHLTHSAPSQTKVYDDVESAELQDQHKGSL